MHEIKLRKSTGVAILALAAALSALPAHAQETPTAEGASPGLYSGGVVDILMGGDFA